MKYPLTIKCTNNVYKESSVKKQAQHKATKLFIKLHKNQQGLTSRKIKAMPSQTNY